LGNVGGLFGKHDNVRTYWEDQLTRQVLQPYLRERVQACAARGRDVRVLDLGCGAGEGYEVLTRIPEKDLSLDVELQYVLPPGGIEQYLGVGLSGAMVEQSRDNYSAIGRVDFEQGDLRDGVGDIAGAVPFDIYFSSYGSLSHLDTATLRALSVLNIRPR